MTASCPTSEEAKCDEIFLCLKNRRFPEKSISSLALICLFRGQYFKRSDLQYLVNQFEVLTFGQQKTFIAHQISAISVVHKALPADRVMRLWGS